MWRFRQDQVSIATCYGQGSPRVQATVTSEFSAAIWDVNEALSSWYSSSVDVKHE
jgi:hypothetical protein